MRSGSSAIRWQFERFRHRFPIFLGNGLGPHRKTQPRSIEPETVTVSVKRAGEQIGKRAREELTIQEGHDTMGQRLCLAGVMTGNDYRRAGRGMQLSDDLFDQLRVGIIHVGSGLVEEQDFGLNRQDACQGNSLSFSAGKLAVGTARQFVQADESQHVLGLSPRLSPSHAAYAQPVDDVLEHGGPEQYIPLKQHGAASPRGQRVARRPYIATVQQDAAVVGFCEKGHGFQQR